MKNCVFARIAALCSVAGLAGTAVAAPLNLQLENDPDIVAGFIDVVYDADSNDLFVDGFALEIDDDGVGMALPITGDALFTIDASIDEMGEASIGSLTITGLVAGLGFGSGTLLSATLIDFGFTATRGGTILEFLWQITGGDAAGLYGGVGAQAGTILTGSKFPGSWAGSWSNLDDDEPGTGGGNADTAPLVPAPMSAGVLALFAGAAVRRRRSA